MRDDYFLSATNPLATADQKEVEARALRIVAMPAVQAGRQRAEARIRTIAGKEGTTEGWNQFPAFMEEWTFSYVVKAVIGDPNHPRIAQIFTLPHTGFGMRVPGSRAGGGPGPDQAYQSMPIDYGACYELVGQRREPRLWASVQAPSVEYELIKLSELPTKFPGLKRVSPAERQRQLLQRRTSYDLRFVHC